MELFCYMTYGKSPCYGIGGTVKRLARRASLQSAVSGHILTLKDLFKWAETNISGIKFFFVSSEDIKLHAHNQEERMACVRTVAGTRSHHCFVPDGTNHVKMYRLSSDYKDNTNVTRVLVVNDEPRSSPAMQDLVPGQYVAAVYDDYWYIVCIEERNDADGDVLANFMHRNPATKALFWPAI